MGFLGSVWFVVCRCCVNILVVCVWLMFSLLCFFLVGCSVVAKWFPSENGRQLVFRARALCLRVHLPLGFQGELLLVEYIE